MESRWSSTSSMPSTARQPLVVQMRVQTQQVVVGVAVTEARPGRYAGVGGVPATLLGSAGCSESQNVFVAAQSKRSAR